MTFSEHLLGVGHCTRHMGVYYLQEEVVFVPFFTLGGTSTDLASNLSIITQQASGEMQ